MRAVYSYGIAGAIIVVVALWLTTGTFVAGGKGPGNGERPIISFFEEDGGPMTTAIEDVGLAPAHENGGEGIDPHLTIAERVAQDGGSEAQARSVRTQTFTLKPYLIEAPLRGRTKAKAQVSVMPETSGVVDEVRVAKGDKVAAGELICRLDQGTRQAAVMQAKAALAQAQSQFDTNAQLRKEGLAPANSALQLAAALQGAKAQLENAEAELERTEIRAKVAGVVQDPLATPGQLLGPQAPCATIVELDPMLFVGAVPEARIGLAKTGLQADVTTITGTTITGKVSYIASIADPATRSFAIEIELPNGDGTLKDGLTATAKVNLGTAPAHLLPQSVLTLDNDGVLGVRSVVDNVVQFHPVTIIGDTRDGIWVTGLPPKVDIITVGQEYVVAGQRVNATNVTAGAGDDMAPAESVQS